MKTYKFKIGQLVFVRAPRTDHASGDPYIITKRLPAQHGQLQYQVRSSSKDCDLVVRESEIRYHSH